MMKKLALAVLAFSALAVAPMAAQARVYHHGHHWHHQPHHFGHHYRYHHHR